MIDLVEATNVHSSAQAELCRHSCPAEVRAAVSLLGLLIEEHRELVKNLTALAETMNYGVVG